MKKLLLVIFLCCNGIHAIAQLDISRYIDDNVLPLLNLQDHLELKFKWDMPGNVQLHMNEGINFLVEKDLQLALNNFNEVIKLHSSSWIGYYYRGVCHKKLFLFKDAEKDFLNAKRFRPNQGEIYIELGDVYQAQRDFTNAQVEYEKAITTNSTWVQGYYKLGCLLFLKGEKKKALRYFQKCNEVRPGFAEALVMQGVIKFQDEKKGADAINFLTKATLADSTYSPAHFWRGYIYLSQNQPKESMREWNKLVSRNPSILLYTLMRGFVHAQLGDFDKAFIDFKQVITFDFKRAALRPVDEEKYIGAQTLLDKEIDLYVAAKYLIANGYGLDEEAFKYLKQGICQLLISQKLSGLVSIKKAVHIQPSAPACFLEAVAHEHMNEHNQAYVFYSMALQLDKDLFDAYKKRSTYRTEMKDWKGVHEDFKEMLRLQPSSPIVYRLMGLSKSNEGDYQGAIDDLTRFIKTDSSDYEAIRTRSACYFLIKNEKEATNDLRRLLYIKNDWEIYDKVLQNYLILKDTANAISLGKEYIRLRRRFIPSQMQLVDIYISQKKWDLAKPYTDNLILLIDPVYLPTEYAKVLFWQGLIALHQSSYELAATKFTKSMNKGLKNLEIKFYRAKAYEMSGQKVKALADLRDLKDTGFKGAKELYDKLNTE